MEINLSAALSRRNRTTILKFMSQISKKEQRERLQAQTPSRPAGHVELARTPKDRAFTAASTAACLVHSGEPSPSSSLPRRAFSNRWF